MLGVGVVGLAEWFLRGRARIEAAADRAHTGRAEIDGIVVRAVFKPNVTARSAGRLKPAPTRIKGRLLGADICIGRRGPA